MISSYLKKISLKVRDLLQGHLAWIGVGIRLLFFVEFAGSLIVVIWENDVEEEGRLKCLELV